METYKNWEKWGKKRKNEIVVKKKYAKEEGKIHKEENGMTWRGREILEIGEKGKKRMREIVGTVKN